MPEPETSPRKGIRLRRPLGHPLRVDPSIWTVD